MEERDNIAFVQIIEKYPCLYDYTMIDYTKRDINEITWNLVSKEANIPVSVCKQKWKNLRTAFSRAQKKCSSGSLRGKIKKYYIQDAMQFILPFIKSRGQSRSLSSPNSESTDEAVETIDPAKKDDNNIKTESDATNHKSDEPIQTVSSRGINIKRVKYETALKKFRSKPSTSLETDKSLQEYSKKDTSTDSDLEFFHSLLPDIAKMDCKRKRSFKRCTLELIDTILSEQEEEELLRRTSATSSPSM